MASLSTVIQGLLVAQLPEYEISNDAIGYLSDFSGKLLLQLINEAVLLVQNTRKSVSENEVKEAINKVFPKTWASLIIGQASVQLSSTQNEEKDALKQEISDFELIDDEQLNTTPQVENRAAGNLFLSAEFIKSFLPASIASRVDSDGCAYLSASLESVLSTLIQQSRVTLTHQSKEDPMVITKNALVETIQVDEQLAQLSKGLSLYPATADEADFEPVEEEVEEEATQTVETQNEDVVQETLEEEPSAEEEKDVEGAKEQAEQEQQEEKQDETAEQVPEAVEQTVNTTPVVESNESAVETTSIPEVPKVEVKQVDEAKPVIEEKVAEIADVAQSDVGSEYLFSDTPSDIASVRRPVFALYGRCCPYFDVTTFAIHMLSSIMELFIRHLISETRSVYNSKHTRPLKQHAREALKRLSTFKSQMLDEIEKPRDGNLFQECVSNTINIVPKRSDWDMDLEVYIADMVLYVASRLLLVASAHARVAGKWLINSDNIASASLTVFSSSSPISQLVNQLTAQKSSSVSGEGPLLTPPAAPRIRAAEMIYLTSIIKETPLQLDNQLLVVFMFLVTLSIHTLCCVR